MEIHKLKIRSAYRNKKRVGRGGKRGTTSGRGQKGQKSRAGHRIRPAVRDTINRLPKLRGFANKIKRPKPIILNLDKIGKLNGEISPASLKAAGLISKKYRGAIKILGKGDGKNLQIKGIRLSKSAENKIQKAGGGIIK
ncbi:uL15 family ribosomal protein [Patescibacteria group bacterium]|nr:uL15 family ribosomal protein [Patescibacteria group bacterium]MCL5733480.1 uL15 family ribosomal protein [Patescibacteria group bacterium]